MNSLTKSTKEKCINEKSVSENCMICLEETNVYALTQCGCRLYVHDDCFQSWLKLYNSCIICKSRLDPYSKKRAINYKYLDKEISKSTIFLLLEKIANFILKKSTNIKNPTLKFILFNMGFGCMLFIMLVCILFGYLVISQIKYHIDHYMSNNIYGAPYQYVTIKN